MKKIALFIVMILTINVIANENRVKIFPFKSAIIEYKYEASFKGTHIKYIDDYGYKQADYIRKSLNFGGNSENEYETIILIGNKAYTMNLNDTTIAVGRNETYGYYLQNRHKNCIDVSEALLKAAEGWHFVGTKEFLGKACKAWKHTKHKKLTWQGLLLKSQINFMTMMVEKATKLEIDVDIPQHKFEIPHGYKYISSDVYQGFSGLKLNFDSLDVNIKNEDNQITTTFNSSDLGGCNNFAYYVSNGVKVIPEGVNDYNKIDNMIIKSQEMSLVNEKVELSSNSVSTLIFKTNDGNFGKLQLNKDDKGGYGLRYMIFNTNGTIKNYSDDALNVPGNDFKIYMDDVNNKIIITPKGKAKCFILGW